jgi:hypothetical protein
MIFIAFLITYSFVLSNLIVLQYIFNSLNTDFIRVFKTDFSKSDKKHCLFIRDIITSILRIVLNIAVQISNVTVVSRLRLKCDDTRAEPRFRLSAKMTSPFKSAGASVQSTTGSRGVRISGSNAGYTMFWGGVRGTGYPLHSPVSPSLTLPCVTVCRHISTGLYTQ